MPIILPEGLASAAMLQREGIETLQRPPRHSSPLLVVLLNLMPDMTRAEMQFARLLGVAGGHVELLLALPPAYRSGHEGTGRYARWGATSLPHRLDGLIVTGAPLEHLPFEDVTYWRELTYIGDQLHRTRCRGGATHIPSTGQAHFKADRVDNRRGRKPNHSIPRFDWDVGSAGKPNETQCSLELT